MFRKIETIFDILPHIEGKDNFTVNYKDDYIVVNYILNTPEYFNNPWEKECRGLIFDKDGNIMSRPFQKFFNIGEREETKIENIDFSKPHWILEKVDGSFIRSIITDGKLTWASKAGITFLTPMVEEFVEKNKQYYTFAAVMMNHGLTPIFEFCSRKNKIVIDHPFDRLVLLGIRDNITGKYHDYELLQDFSRMYNIELVKQYYLNDLSLTELLELAKKLTNQEGFVIRFEDGNMIKLKSEEYCLLHKSKEELHFEKNVVSIIIEDKADDFRVLLSKEDREKFEEFEYKFWKNFEEYVMDIYNLHYIYNISKISRKDFALLSKDWKYKYHRSILFTFFDKIDFSIVESKKELLNILRKNLGTQTSIDKVREIWEGKEKLKWNY